MIKSFLLEIYFFAYQAIPYQLLLFLLIFMIVNLLLETIILIKTKSWHLKAWLVILLRRLVCILLIGLCRGLDLSLYNLLNFTFVQIILVLAYISQEIRFLAKNLLFLRQKKISTFLFRFTYLTDSFLIWVVDRIFFFFKKN